MTAKEIYESVERGLRQTASIDRGSFAKYVEDDLYKTATDTVTDTVSKDLRG